MAIEIEIEEEYDDGDAYLDEAGLPMQSTIRCQISADELDCRVKAASTALHSLTGRSLCAWPSKFATTVLSEVPMEKFGVRLPHGPLFYPCAGDDVDDAVRMFGRFVSTYHFADLFHPHQPSLGQSRRLNRFDSTPIVHVGQVHPYSGTSWQLVRGGATLVIHQKDALLTLMDDLPALSVFYYRGDSAAEGGSSQRWMSCVLLDQVLSRMYDGGLICSDGSNGDDQLIASLMALPVGAVHAYRHIFLRCLANNMPGKRQSKPMWVWQVTSHS
jgi:hypothetical protein